MRLLSRNAENFFWLARYLERGASLARVIENQSSFGGHEKDEGWNWLLTLHSDEERFRKTFEQSPETIIKFYVTDSANPGSVKSSIHWARENARSLRSFIPLEMWAQLNALHTMIGEFGEHDIQRSELSRTCAKIRAGCLAQAGIAEGTLYRDEGYQFFKLGTMIERADQTSRLLDVKFAQNAQAQLTADPVDDFVFWSMILRTAGAFQMFHRFEPADADADGVVRFLVFNPNHPCSIRFCLRETRDALEMLRRGFSLATVSSSLGSLEMLMNGLHTIGQAKALPDELHGFNDWVQRALMKLTAEIAYACFRAPAPESNSEPPMPKVRDEVFGQTSGQGAAQVRGQSQSQSQKLS